MMLRDYPLLILLAPLAAALLTALPGAWIGRKVYWIGGLVQAAAFGLAVWVLHEVAAPGHDPIRISLFPSPWSSLVDFELSIDRLAAVMMALITGIGSLIYLYSVRYMQSERGRARFHTLLALTVFVLLCMVSSANLLMLFLFWQLLSWLLSLLAYNYAHPPTVKGAFRTFTILRLGDVAFLAGIILAYGLYGTLDFDPLFRRAAEDPVTFSLFGPDSGIEVGAATVVTLLIFIGAMSKSAQFPLHMWLPDSLYAPTPVHALLHAGIINAGGFLLNRLAPLYGLSPPTLHLVFAVGLLTSLLGALMMLAQNDIKKTLGYSTIGQMGYMIMECGLGAFALAVFHLIAHGLFKATIFLNCGHVIHAARLDPRLPPSRNPDDATAGETGFALLTWLTGFATTLILPLIILLAAHGVLNITFRDSQGVVIFLFFSWVTSSQAILTLYRLRAVASRKVAALMLLTLLLVVSTYLLAAEAFTYFLYPAPGEVAAYFRAASLSAGLFDGLVAATALFVILGWIFLYAKSHGRSIRMPEWVGGLQVRFYLFFMNRLYMDALFFRLGRGFARAARRLDRSRLFAPLLALIAAGLVLPAAARAANLPAATLALFVATALMLPLFPLHGIYIAALTRLPGYGSVPLAVLLPLAGYYGLVGLLPDLPPELLGGMGRLALVGALYGSFKAMVQDKPKRMPAYTGLALFSMLWWYLSFAGSATPPAAVYAGSAALVTGGLIYALHRLEARYGDLGGDQEIGGIGGLARPMPRFAALLGLLVMGAVGMPPFGLFSGFMAMLLTPSVAPSIGMPGALPVVLLAWFAASWYLFRMMQRLLFGPHRPDIFYEDLRASEVVFFVIVLGALIGLGLAPSGFFAPDALTKGYHAALEFKSWNP
ncbi:MAG TPA: proton-conducting transporter membrane subunit [Nitrospiria bacterium]|nr:proton-conducting transporter membrane subunit [Nitrospiria bacterium]